MSRALATIMIAWLASACVAQTTATLRSVVRLPEGRVLTIGDLATLSGPLASRVGGVEVPAAEADPSGWRTFDRSQIHDLLTDTIGDLGSMVVVRGGPSAVRIGAVIRAASVEPAAVEPAEQPDANAVIAELTVRGHIARRIASLLAAEASDLRLAFDPRDDDLLNSLTIGRIVHAQPIGSGDRIPFDVKVFENERLIASGSVRVEVTQRMPAAVVSSPVARGEALSSTNLAADRLWRSPADRLVAFDDALGQIAKKSLSPGTVIEAARIQPATVVRRGDLVNVSVVTGAAVVTAECRARADALVGEVIEFEFKNDRRRTVRALVEGPGRAVSVTNEPGKRGMPR